MKKFLSLILALVMVASLAACGGNAGGGEKTDDASAPKDETKTEAPAASGGSEKIWPNGTPTVYIGYGAGGGRYRGPPRNCRYVRVPRRDHQLHQYGGRQLLRRLRLCLG